MTSSRGTMKLIDIGANLTDPMFQGSYHGREGVHPADLDCVLARAWEAGVCRIIITATNLEESRAALHLARQDSRLFCTAGVHPTRCGEIESSAQGPHGYWDELREVLQEGVREGKAVAVGECGLDADRTNFCNMETQERWFTRHFELAAETGLPMFLHLRSAAPAFFRIMEAQASGAVRGVVHSFDGSWEEAQQALAIPGLSIGLNGCSLKTDANLEVVARLPIDRILLETDAPWCEIRPSHASAKHVGERPAAKDKKKWSASAWVKSRNEPAGMVQVLAAVAGTRNTDPGELACQAYTNTVRLFFPGETLTQEGDVHSLAEPA